MPLKFPMTVVCSVLFILFSVPVFFAQKVSQEKKIVLLNKLAFDDEKNGVKKVVEAWKLVESCEFNPEWYENYVQIQTLEKELLSNDLSFASKDEKLKKLDQLKRRSIELENQRKERFEQKKTLFLNPVLKKIDVQIANIAEQNNLIVLDGAELEEKGLLLAFNKNINITDKIIPAINEYFKTDITPTLNFDVPETKLVLINLNEFNLSVMSKNQPTSKNDISAQRDLINKIQKFADEKGFQIILDSSKTMPDELKNFQFQDVTKDFISYYNQLNP